MSEEKPDGPGALKRAMDHAYEGGAITKAEYNQIVADINEVKACAKDAAETVSMFGRIYEAFKQRASKNLHDPESCTRSILGSFDVGPRLHYTVELLREWLRAPTGHPSARALFLRMVESIPRRPGGPRVVAMEIGDEVGKQPERTPGPIETEFMVGWHKRFIDLCDEASEAGFPCAFVAALDDSVTACGTFIPDGASANAIATLELIRPALERGWVPVPPEAVEEMEDHAAEMPNHRVTVGEA